MDRCMPKSPTKTYLATDASIGHAAARLPEPSRPGLGPASYGLLPAPFWPPTNRPTLAMRKIKAQCEDARTLDIPSSLL